MKVQNTSTTRSRSKSFENMFIVKLETDYSLSPVEAWTLTDDLQDFIHTNATSVLQEGELYFTAVVANEPAGKPLMKCQTKQIKLCVYPTEKELIELSFSDLKRYHFIMVSRLCWQAIHQGCCLSQEDLARLLHCSVSTIRRILKQYRELGQLLPTRGNYCDIGPGISHKTETIKHYLKGETVSEISLRLAHHSQSIERYIDDFCLVVSGYATDNLSVIRLSRSLKMSEKLVTEYIDLYEQVKTDPDYQLRLQQILTRIDELFNRTKKNNRRRP